MWYMQLAQPHGSSFATKASMRRLSHDPVKASVEMSPVETANPLTAGGENPAYADEGDEAVVFSDKDVPAEGTPVVKARFLTGDITFGETKSEALAISMMLMPIWFTLLLLFGINPSTVELLMADGTLAVPIEDRQAIAAQWFVPEMWVTAILIAACARYTLVLNKPVVGKPSKLAFLSLVTFVYFGQQTVEMTNLFLGLLNSLLAGGDECIEEACSLVAHEERALGSVPACPLVTANFSFCSITQVSKFCAADEECNAHVHSILFRQELGIYILAILLVVNCFAFARVIIHPEKNHSAKRREVEQRHVTQLFHTCRRHAAIGVADSKLHIGQQFFDALDKVRSEQLFSKISSLADDNGQEVLCRRAALAIVRETVMPPLPVITEGPLPTLKVLLQSMARAMSPTSLWQSMRGQVQKARGSKPSKQLDAITYLPAGVWIGHLAGVLCVLFIAAAVIGGVPSYKVSLTGTQAQVMSTISTLQATDVLVSESAAQSEELNQQVAESRAGLVQIQALLDSAERTGTNVTDMRATITQLEGTLDIVMNVSNTFGDLAAQVGPGTPAHRFKQSGVKFGQRLHKFLGDVKDSIMPALVIASVIALGTCILLTAIGLVSYRDQQINIRLGRHGSSAVHTNSQQTTPPLPQDVFQQMQHDRPSTTQASGQRVAEPSRYSLMAGGAGIARGWRPARWKASASLKFIGLQIGSSVFGSVAVLVLSFFVIFVLLWEDTWGFLKSTPTLPVGALLAIFQVYVLEGKLGNKCLSDGYWVKDRNGWTWFSWLMLCINLITGLFFAFRRFAILFFCSLVAVFRLDYTQFPSSVAAMDTGYLSFMAMQVFAHRHRSPIIHTFVSELASMRSGQGGSSVHATAAAQVKAKRSRSRWHLAITLLNNPQLIAERGHHLKHAREKAAEASAEAS